MLYTRSRIESLVVSVIIIMILALLVIPVYVLYRLSLSDTSKTSLECICVLLIATLLFSICMSVVTRMFLSLAPFSSESILRCVLIINRCQKT